MNSPSAYLNELRPGVFAYVQPPGGWCVNNAGIVTDHESPLVIDSVATELRARRFVAQVDELTEGAPPSVVVTHHHGDHHFGNCFFPETREIISHEQCRVEMLEAGLGMKQLWASVDFGDGIEVVEPTRTFSETISLHEGHRDVKLIHLGPAHTTNDIVAFLPNEEVLFSGDIVMSGSTPYCLMGSISGSIRALQTLKSLGDITIVPGHGPVGGQELVDENLHYLEWLSDVASSAYKRGIPAEELAQRPEAQYERELSESERFVSNIDRAYLELWGEPEGARIDIAASFMKMIRVHGRVPECAA